MVITVVLAAATLSLPWHLATAVTGAPWSGPAEFTNSIRLGLIGDWSRGIMDPGTTASALADEAAFWRWFHAIKALLAAGALLSSATLTGYAWRAMRSSTHSRKRFTWLIVSGAGSAIALVTSLVVIANVQGALAPLSSVLSFLPSTGSDPDLARAVTDLRAIVAGTRAPSAMVVGDFARYHAVVAVMLGLAAFLAVMLGARLLRHREWFAGGGAAVVAVAFTVLTFANAATAINPVPALDTFLRGVAG